MTGIDMLRPVNRIDQRFQNLREQNRKGFVAYIGAGDPDLASTEALALRLADSGVDILELGVPFSDPLADGLVNQLAAQRGLASGTTPERLLETVAAIRKQSNVPIVLYIYFNIMHRRGLKEFIDAAAAAGVDGLLALDLPPEEADEYEQLMKKAGLCSIWLIAPRLLRNALLRLRRAAAGLSITFPGKELPVCGRILFRAWMNGSPPYAAIRICPSRLGLAFQMPNKSGKSPQTATRWSSVVPL